MPTPPLVLELRPSRLARAALLTLQLLALAAALASERPWWQSLLLLSLIAAFLWLADRRALQRGCVQLRLQETAPGDLQVSARFADGATCAGACAGWSPLGTLGIFLFVERRRRLAGARRIVILRDATDADGFRRLRARLRTL